MTRTRTRTLHRAVITGLGAITPIGKTVEDFWDGLRSGRNGIGSALCHCVYGNTNASLVRYIDRFGENI